MASDVRDTSDEQAGQIHQTLGSLLGPRYKRYRHLRFSDGEMATILLAPVLAYLFAISYYPIVETVWTSLHTGSVLPNQTAEFVGLEHYWAVISSPSFQNAFVVSMIYTFVSVPIELVIGLGLALLVNREFKGKYLAQAAILFPWALPTIINARIWSWLFHGEYGVINDMLVRVGIIESPYPFLSNPDAALAAMLFVTIWKTSSFIALILLAGLQSIPEHLYEAAKIDGAERFGRFRHVTLPLLKPVILVALIFRTLPAFQAFGLPYGLTGGGPGEATTTLVLWAHQHTFTRLNFGEGAAAATIITLVALVICLVYVGTLYEPEVR